MTDFDPYYEEFNTEPAPVPPGRKLKMSVTHFEVTIVEGEGTDPSYWDIRCLGNGYEITTEEAKNRAKEVLRMICERTLKELE